MKLSYDIFWYVGRDYLIDPVDVLALASTCRDLWALLENEIYIADVLDVKSRIDKWSSENRCESLPYDDDIATENAEEALPNGAQAAGDGDVGMTGTEHVDVAGSHIPGVESSAPSQTATLAARPQGRFPPESSILWIKVLQEEYPQGGIHVLASKGPVSSLRKAIAVARKLWPAYLDLRDTFGDAPIHLAARYGQLEVVRLLVSPQKDGGAGCAARAASEYICWDPRSLHEVINHLTLTAEGVKNKVMAEGFSTCPRLPRLRKQMICLNKPSGGGYFGLSTRDLPFVTDALGFAILGGHVDIAELLLAQPCHDCDVIHSMGDKWLDDGGHPIMSPLHLAALVGMPSVVKMLIAKGVDPNMRQRCFHNCSPLHMASTRDGTRDAVKVLLDHGADLSQLDDEGRTVVQWAEAFGVEGLPEWLKSLDIPRTESLRASFIPR